MAVQFSESVKVPTIDNISVCLNTLFADSKTKLYPTRGVAEQLEIVRAAGLTAFEFWDWRDTPVREVATEVERHGMKVALMAGQRKHSLFKDDDFSALQQEVTESIAQAHPLGCSSLTVIVDEPDKNWHFTRTYPGLGEFDKYKKVISGLSRLADIVGEDVTLHLEHFNTVYDHPGYWLDSVEKGFVIVDRVGRKNVKLLLDIYHMGIMEGNLIEKICRNIDLVGHIQIASVPTRNEPFLGEVNYQNVVGKIVGAGYSGYIGLEYYPTLPVEESLARTVHHLLEAE